MKINSIKSKLKTYLLILVITGLAVSFGSYVKLVNAAATITVNSVADDADDDGECTLREAITAANDDTASGATLGECIAGDGTDTIQFGISGSGVKTIALLTALPDITTPLSIDGYTQTGATVNTNPAPQGVDTVLTVALDGSSCVGSCDLTVDGATNVLIRGLSIHSLDTSTGGAISVVNSSNVIVEGNFVGVTPAGAAAGNSLVGLHVGPGSDSVTLGSSSASGRNVVANNALSNPASDNVLITDDSTDSVTNITVVGNIIGLNPAATTAGSETSMGIRIKNGVNGVTIGGPLSTDANVIGAFDSMGVGIIQEDDNTNGVANRSIEVRNNLIGYAGDGTTNVMTAGSNSGVGIVVLDPSIPAGSDQTNIDVTDNSISGTGLFGGIGAFNASADVDYSDIIIQRNDLDGQGFVGQAGIMMGGNVLDIMAGATSPANSNTITDYALGINVMTLGASPQDVAVFGNNITNSTNHGIDLCEDSDFNFICDVEDGPTANDADDADSGANNYMNTPVVNSASQVGDQLTVNFDLDAADSPTDSYRIDFYLNDTADGSGFGEGQVYLGGTNSINGTANEVTITIDDSINIENGVLTATTTAVDNTTSSGYGATSEFSAVLSDNITYEPAPETDPEEEAPAETTDEPETEAESESLSETGQQIPQILVAVSLVASVGAMTYIRRRTS